MASKKIEDHYSDGQEFEDILLAAEDACEFHSQRELCNRLRRSWDQYGMIGFLSDSENKRLREIAGIGND